MWRYFVLASLFLPMIAEASELENDRAWRAFKSVCLETVGNIETALNEIPNRVVDHVSTGKITDPNIRTEQMIHEGEDAWSYRQGSEWFMIITDYGSCSVRAPQYWRDYDSIFTKKFGYTHFKTEVETHLTFEYYYQSKSQAPVIVVGHTEKAPGNRLAVTAYNFEVYNKAIREFGSDFPPLPE